MKIMFIQYGDFREAYRNFESGNSETYKAQRYSVDYVINLGKQSGCQVSVLCVNANERYSEELCDNVQVKGLLNKDIKTSRLLDAVNSYKPTHIVLRTPIQGVIKYALSNDVNVLPLFADYFSSKNIIQWYKNIKLSRLLNNAAIPVISNHNIPACESLSKIGVHRSKILPWDWPQNRSADDYSVRQLPTKDINLLYVGAVSEEKGVFDCLAAMRELNESQYNYSLKIIGPGELNEAELYRTNNGLKNVKILGTISNDSVLNEMREADIVIVPSRHKYPEGMPNTIYESLSMKTPLMLSDHPVFISRFTDKKDVVFFKASDPDSLAKSIRYLSSHPDLYRMLSERSLDLLTKLETPLKWGELISKWMHGEKEINDMRIKYSLQ